MSPIHHGEEGSFSHLGKKRRSPPSREQDMSLIHHGEEDSCFHPREEEEVAIVEGTGCDADPPWRRGFLMLSREEEEFTAVEGEGYLDFSQEEDVSPIHQPWRKGLVFPCSAEEEVTVVEGGGRRRSTMEKRTRVSNQGRGRGLRRRGRRTSLIHHREEVTAVEG